MRYQLQIKPRAARQLRKLPDAVRVRCEQIMSALTESPRPAGTLKMKGFSNRYRVRSGDYRIVYDIHDDVLIVLIVEVGHRSDVYR